MSLSARHPAHFTLFARDMVYGIVDTSYQAEALRRDLSDLGILDTQILSGAAGLVDLDPDGHHHGLACRLARAVQGLTREHDFIGWYAEQLKAGHVLVCLHARGQVRLQAVRAAFTRQGGHHVNHYGLLMVEVLCP
ncbi:hypothetical protein [Deinococcus rufus]|uniref:Uncharacterized protein n=1 Tax=Deinococcus rufus TaxID=2136097 RepID=A0ABV7ZAV3_9DEIO